MIKHGKPYCDKCEAKLEALTEKQCLNSVIGHGWENWKTAYKHYCYECSSKLWQPPCDTCENQTCEEGKPCWANPPLHLFPYETYYAEKAEKPIKIHPLNHYSRKKEPKDRDRDKGETKVIEPATAGKNQIDRQLDLNLRDLKEWKQIEYRTTTNGSVYGRYKSPTKDKEAIVCLEDGEVVVIEEKGDVTYVNPSVTGGLRSLITKIVTNQQGGL